MWRSRRGRKARSGSGRAAEPVQAVSIGTLEPGINSFLSFSKRVIFLAPWGLNLYTKKGGPAVFRIRDLVPFLPLDPGSGMGKKSGSGSGIRDEHPGLYFRELRHWEQFLG